MFINKSIQQLIELYQVFKKGDTTVVRVVSCLLISRYNTSICITFIKKAIQQQSYLYHVFQKGDTSVVRVVSCLQYFEKWTKVFEKLDTSWDRDDGKICKKPI